MLWLTLRQQLLQQIDNNWQALMMLYYNTFADISTPLLQAW